MGAGGCGGGGGGGGGGGERERERERKRQTHREQRREGEREERERERQIMVSIERSRSRVRKLTHYNPSKQHTPRGKDLAHVRDAQQQEAEEDSNLQRPARHGLRSVDRLHLRVPRHLDGDRASEAHCHGCPGVSAGRGENVTMDVSRTTSNDMIRLPFLSHLPHTMRPLPSPLSRPRSAPS